ncbi:hypothetical protein V5O48_013308 [Marasmius crinis-equi]|uniref:DUF6535 domain-containing protein n=1 Tax=Marasmius crinis-equi TaxID=585013 RepID=A0ABR3F0T1_9AGAR
MADNKHNTFSTPPGTIHRVCETDIALKESLQEFLDQSPPQEDEVDVTDSRQTSLRDNFGVEDHSAEQPNDMFRRRPTTSPFVFSPIPENASLSTLSFVEDERSLTEDMGRSYSVSNDAQGVENSQRDLRDEWISTGFLPGPSIALSASPEPLPVSQSAPALMQQSTYVSESEELPPTVPNHEHRISPVAELRTGAADPTVTSGEPYSTRDTTVPAADTEPSNAIDQPPAPPGVLSHSPATFPGTAGRLRPFKSVRYADEPRHRASSTPSEVSSEESSDTMPYMSTVPIPSMPGYPIGFFPNPQTAPLPYTSPYSIPQMGPTYHQETTSWQPSEPRIAPWYSPRRSYSFSTPQVYPNQGFTPNATPRYAPRRGYSFSTPQSFPYHDGLPGGPVSNIRPVYHSSAFDPFNHRYPPQAHGDSTGVPVAASPVINPQNPWDQPLSAPQHNATPTHQYGPPTSNPAENGNPNHAASKGGSLPLPLAVNPWEISVIKAAQKYDDEMSRGWKEDLDTLLVFAALFSAVVTAFTVESYRWLSEDPEDATVALLSVISQQLDRNFNGNTSSSPLSTPFKAFNPSVSSALRINSFWFLSIITSLLSAFFGILCKQWLREHTRETQTRSRAEALALRQLRRESFEKWGIPSMIATLPVLLELSLLLFFAGVLELLWILHKVPFAIAAGAVGLGGGLYIITTILPALTILRISLHSPLKNGKENFLESTPLFHFICPFKSPQAWGVFTALRKLIGAFPSLPSFPGAKKHRRLPSLVRKLRQAAHWLSLDLHHVRRFDENPTHFHGLHPFITATPEKDLQVYELQGLRGLVNDFHDIPSMGPHMEKILLNYEPSTVMAAVFNEWKLCTWRTSPIRREDVRACLHDLSLRTSQSHFANEKLRMCIAPDFGLDGRIEDDRARPPASLKSPLHSLAYVQLLYFQQYWTKAVLRQHNVPIMELIRYTELFMGRKEILEQTGIRFPIPFRAMAALWTHPEVIIRHQSIHFIRFYIRSWEYCEGVEDKDDERFALIAALAEHLKTAWTPGRESAIVTTEAGLQLLSFIEKEIFQKRLFGNPRYNDPRGRAGMLAWVAGMELIHGQCSIKIWLIVLRTRKNSSYRLEKQRLKENVRRALSATSRDYSPLDLAATALLRLRHLRYRDFHVAQNSGV